MAFVTDHETSGCNRSQNISHTLGMLMGAHMPQQWSIMDFVTYHETLGCTDHKTWVTHLGCSWEHARGSPYASTMIDHGFCDRSHRAWSWLLWSVTLVTTTNHVRRDPLFSVLVLAKNLSVIGLEFLWLVTDRIST